MAGIEEYLDEIKNAVYGREVRQAIHDGIETCYQDGKAGATDLVARQEIAELVAPSGEAPSAAEVTDARIGADGTTYTSLGLANRTQFDDLKGDIAGYVLGENLVKISATDKVHQGITFTVLSDRIVANGTATGNAFIDADVFVPLKTGRYHLSGCPSGGGSNKYIMYVGGTPYDTGNGALVTLTAGTSYKIRIIVYSGFVADDLTFAPVLEFVENVASYTERINGVPKSFGINDFELEYAAWQSGGKEPSASKKRACTNLFRASGTFTVELDDFSNYRFSVIQYPIDADGEYIDSGWKTSAYTVSVDSKHVFGINLSKRDDTAIDNLNVFDLSITSTDGFHWHLATISDIENISKYIKPVNGVETQSEISDIELMYGSWQSSGKDPSASLTRVCSNLFFASGTFTISLENYNGYRFSVIQYPINPSGNYIDSSWKTSEYTVTVDSEHYFAINLSKSDNSAISDIGVFKPSIVSANGFYWHLATVDDVEVAQEKLQHLGLDQYYYDHTFILDLNKPTADIIIPSESLANINTSYRLGFNMIEANVKALNDGNYIVCHGGGSGGLYFGTQFEHVDGVTDISGIAFADVSMEWVRANVRYRSSYQKYVTYPPTLQEFLYECKKYGMTALIQCTEVAVAEIADEILGKNKWVAYNANRSMTNGLIMSVYSPTSVENALAKCYEHGKPYMLCLGNTMDFSLDELKEIVSAVHSHGYLIGYVQYFINERYNQEYKNLGFDFCASTWSVNRIDSGNICNLLGDLTFDDFVTTGDVTDGIIELAEDETIAPSESLDSVFLGKGELDISFEGQIIVAMGKHINMAFNSETSPNVCISTLFLNESPTFTITGYATNSVIKSITYKASKC